MEGIFAARWNHWREGESIVEKRLSKEPTIGNGCVIVDSSLGEWTEIGGENVLEHVRFDDFSYTGSRCMLQNAWVQKFVNIAPSVRIGATDHPLERPTLHHFTYRKRMYGFSDSDDTEFFAHRESRRTIVAHDAWIGHGALVKPGITIGIGAVVGMGAVVTKSVPDYGIVVGNPARLIRYRFDEKTIASLLRIAWWEWTYEWIKERSEDFSLDIREFVKKYDR